MKILYYSPHPNLTLSSPSGPGTHMREVIGAFENQGHTVIKFIAGDHPDAGDMGPTPSAPWYKRFAKALVPSWIWQTIKDWNLQKFDRQNVLVLNELVLREKPDVIYERAYYLMVSGVEVAKKHELPLIIEMNAPYPEEKLYLEGNSGFVQKSQQREAEQIAAADGIYVVSTALKEYFSNKYPESKQKIKVTPNAINVQRAHGNPLLEQEIRKKYGLTGDEFIIGFVGSIFRYHGVDYLLEAFARLPLEMNGKPFRLIVVGDGMVLPDLKKYATELKVADRVIFVGNVPHTEVYTYIQMMDIAVMARSNWYGSPVKVFEYGAMDKAIIAPDNIPLRDVMENGKDGILVGEGEDEVYDALKKLIENPELRSRLSGSFKNKVLSYYTWDIVAKDITEQASRIVNRKH